MDLLPFLSGLDQVLDMIDSDEDDEDYVPKKKKKKSTAPAAQKTTSLAVSFVCYFFPLKCRLMFCMTRKFLLFFFFADFESNFATK